MCGICGVVNFITESKVNKAVIDNMSKKMIYRGPDYQGEYINGHVGFGHQRLSIIDKAATANQPMSIIKDGKQYVLIFNGEIYNHKEIKSDMEANGEIFTTNSDTEVLLRLLISSGTKGLGRLNGMFAFAFYDVNEEYLLMARDRVGIKPFYYNMTNDGLSFSSEVSSLLESKNSQNELNEQQLINYLKLGYVPGEDTLIKNVKRLLPGNVIEIKNKKIKIKKYWDIKFNNTVKSEASLLRELDEIIHSSIKRQLSSDVPLGVFLSGGLDSSAIVAYMKDLGVENIETFSINWDYGKEFNESEYARIVSDKFGTNHHEYIMNENDFVNFIPKFVEHMGEPVSEAAAISLYYVAKNASDLVTVVLSGEGADEMFGGYPIYKSFNVLERYQKIPNFIRKNIINKILLVINKKFQKYISLSEKDLKKSYVSVPFIEFDESILHEKILSKIKNKYFSKMHKKINKMNLQRIMQYIDLKTWLVDDLLIKADRMTMACSMELRVPFLDNEVLDFSLKMPHKFRLKRNETKYLLKKLLERKLPSEIVYRKKMGFPSPVTRLVNNQLKDNINKLANDKNMLKVFSHDSLVKLTQKESSNNSDSMLLWRVYLLSVWMNTFEVNVV